MKLDANLGYRLELLDEVVEQLAMQEKPVPKFRDNELTGNLWFIRKFVLMDPSQIFLTVFPRSMHFYRGTRCTGRRPAVTLIRFSGIGVFCFAVLHGSSRPMSF